MDTGPGVVRPELALFSQWLVEQQAQLIREVLKHQEQSQFSRVRKLVEEWKLGDSASAGPGNPFWKSPWPWLMKLGDHDELEAYLEVFERAAEVAGWPRELWAFIVCLYLLGEALAALKAVNKPEAADYTTLKKAILDRYEITLESHCQRLQAMSLPEAKSLSRHHSAQGHRNPVAQAHHDGWAAHSRAPSN